jgi:hypothetical protein
MLDLVVNLYLGESNLFTSNDELTINCFQSMPTTNLCFDVYAFSSIHYAIQAYEPVLRRMARLQTSMILADR